MKQPPICQVLSGRVLLTSYFKLIGISITSLLVIRALFCLFLMTSQKAYLKHSFTYYRNILCKCLHSLTPVVPLSLSFLTRCLFSVTVCSH